MYIQAFPCPPLETNAYIVGCKQTQEAAIIDPAPHSFSVIERFLSQHEWKPQLILLTHSHWDHIADTKQFKEHYRIPVYVHRLDAPNLENPGSDGLPLMIDIAPVKPDFLLEEGMEIKVGMLTFQVLHTPGHSAGSVCFYEPNHQLVLTGDTLFRGAIGKISFPTSQPFFMESSLAKLGQLPPQTRVFPGHGPSTTISAESRTFTNYS